MVSKIKPKKAKSLKQEMDNIVKMTAPQAQALILEMMAVNKQLKYTTDAMMTELSDRSVENSQRIAMLEEAVFGEADEVKDPRHANAVKRCILTKEMRERLGVQVEEIKAQKQKEKEACTNASNVEEIPS